MAKKKVYKQALANLQESFELIKNRKNWIQGNWVEFDEDEEGNETPARFCAVGAVEHIDGKGEERAKILLDQAAYELYPKLFDEPDDASVISVNDSDDVKPVTAHARVVKVFKRAIQLAKGA
jgi:hypothetical protein